MLFIMLIYEYEISQLRMKVIIVFRNNNLK